MRGVALAVLATEAIFLWMRRREPEPALSPVQAAARIVWATPRQPAQQNRRSSPSSTACQGEDLGLGCPQWKQALTASTAGCALVRVVAAIAVVPRSGAASPSARGDTGIRRNIPAPAAVLIDPGQVKTGVARKSEASLAPAEVRVQSRGGRLRSLRCNVRLSIDSARALAEILPSFSRSTRLMYSHSARCTDIGFLPMGTSSSPRSR